MAPDQAKHLIRGLPPKGRQTSRPIRRALFLRFALDWPDALIAARDGVTDRAVRYRVERGVGKLAAWLNGRTYIDGYDELEAAA